MVSMQDKEDLKEDVSESRFGGEILDSQEAISEQNKAIHDILMTVLQKWYADRAVKKGAEEEDLSETMVILAGGLNKICSFLPAQDEHEDLPETMILSHSTKSNALKSATQAQLEESEPEDKTVILQESIKPRLIKTKGKKLPDQDFLTETVILKPRNKKENRNDDDKK
jgi:hypothetical protein